MKRLFRLGSYLAAVALAGFFVAASGVIPVTAGLGGIPFARWGLEFAKRRSIVTHSLGVRAPALDLPSLVLRGAGHFETTCRECHGAPAAPVSRIAFGMDPRPPNLPGRVLQWRDGELFSIVKHGIALSGMPAWPATQRDDEVWAMVAFLRRLPGLGASEYQSLVWGEQEPSTDVLATCARCHGADGGGRGTGAFPKLAGQSPTYLRSSLEAFARGARHSGIMKTVAVTLNPETLERLANYYGGLAPSANAAPAADTGKGAQIALRGIPEQGVPSCNDCHGPGAETPNPSYPKLAGQYEEYLVAQLQLFAEERRGGTRYAHIMQQVAPRMKPHQMREVARYYASLPSAPD
jgi:cytochrome c553